MSSLWTPSGEHFPKREGDDDPNDPGDDTDVTQTSGEGP